MAIIYSKAYIPFDNFFGNHNTH